MPKFAVVKEMVRHEVTYIEADDAEDAAHIAMNPNSDELYVSDHGVCQSERVIAVEDGNYHLYDDGEEIENVAH